MTITKDGYYVTRCGIVTYVSEKDSYYYFNNRIHPLDIMREATPEEIAKYSDSKIMNASPNQYGCVEGNPLKGKEAVAKETPPRLGTTAMPPLGLRPRHILLRDRQLEILDAMKRYVDEGKRIPDEWFSELSKNNDEATSCEKVKLV
jgi:hypothetical protein